MRIRTARKELCGRVSCYKAQAMLSALMCFFFWGADAGAEAHKEEYVLNIEGGENPHDVEFPTLLGGPLFFDRDRGAYFVRGSRADLSILGEKEIDVQLVSVVEALDVECFGPERIEIERAIFLEEEVEVKCFARTILGLTDLVEVLESLKLLEN